MLRGSVVLLTALSTALPWMATYLFSGDVVPTADSSNSAVRAISLNGIHMSRGVVEDRGCFQSGRGEIHVSVAL